MVVSLQVLHPQFHMPFSFLTCLVHAPHVSSLLFGSSRDSEHALKPVQVLCSYLCLAETYFCLEEQRNYQLLPCSCTFQVQLAPCSTLRTVTLNMEAACSSRTLVSV
jgi:hypothetical protein